MAEGSMTLTLALDLETNGLIDRNLGLDDPGQPHLVELGAVLFDDADVEVGIYQSLIKPTDWNIGDSTAAIHGITTEYARSCGVGIKNALLALMGLVERADIIVAHNMAFERQIIAIELMRLKAQGQWWLQRSGDMRCTMALSKDLVKLPGRYNDYKYPKLSEAMDVLCPGEPVKHAHRSLGDARSCLKLWRAIEPILRKEATNGDRSVGGTVAAAGDPADAAGRVDGG